MKYALEETDTLTRTGAIEVPGSTGTRLRIVDLGGDEYEIPRRGLEISQRKDFTGDPVWEPVDRDHHGEETIKQLANYVVTLDALLDNQKDF